MRLYEPVITKTTHFRFPDCFVVELAVLNAALQAHPCNSDYRPRPASANPRTIKMLKLGRALMAIDAGEEIVAPWIHYLIEDDGLQLIDGRHRLYAMTNRNYTHVKIMCDRGMQPLIERRLEQENSRMSGEG